MEQEQYLTPREQEVLAYPWISANALVQSDEGRKAMRLLLANYDYDKKTAREIIRSMKVSQ